MPKWLLIGASGVPVSSCEASDIYAARITFGWRPDSPLRIQSKASHDVSWTPKVTGRCTKCFREASCDPCAPCERKLERKAKGMRKVRGTLVPTGKHLAAARDGVIRAGIERRKREA
jgi:hypothetical protein